MPKRGTEGLRWARGGLSGCRGVHPTWVRRLSGEGREGHHPAIGSNPFPGPSGPAGPGDDSSRKRRMAAAAAAPMTATPAAISAGLARRGRGRSGLGCSDSGVSRAPHRSQNCAPSGTVAPHEPHSISVPCHSTFSLSLGAPFQWCSYRSGQICGGPRSVIPTGESLRTKRILDT